MLSSTLLWRIGNSIAIGGGLYGLLSLRREIKVQRREIKVQRSEIKLQSGEIKSLKMRVKHVEDENLVFKNAFKMLGIDIFNFIKSMKVSGIDPNTMTNFQLFGYKERIDEKIDPGTFMFLDVVKYTRRTKKNGGLKRRMKNMKKGITFEALKAGIPAFMVSNGGDSLFFVLDGPIGEDTAEMIKIIKEKSEEEGLPLRIGIISGTDYWRDRFIPLFRTNFGGDTVNLASRIEQSGKKELGKVGGISILCEDKDTLLPLLKKIGVVDDCVVEGKKILIDDRPEYDVCHMKWSTSQDWKAECQEI